MRQNSLTYRFLFSRVLLIFQRVFPGKYCDDNFMFRSVLYSMQKNIHFHTKKYISNWSHCLLLWNLVKSMFCRFDFVRQLTAGEFRSEFQQRWIPRSYLVYLRNSETEIKETTEIGIQVKQCNLLETCSSLTLKLFQLKRQRSKISFANIKKMKVI